MRMDLLQTKTYKQEEWKYERAGMVLFALLLGMTPIGYFLLLPVLLYLSSREDRSHYMVMAAFILGSGVQGLLHACIMLAMVLLWHAFAQLATFSIRHQMGWITLASALISLLIGWLLTLPMPYTMMMIFLQYVGFELLRRNFYQDQEMLLFYGILVIMVCIVLVLKHYVSQQAGLAIMTGLLLYISMVWDMKKTMYLMLLSALVYVDVNQFGFLIEQSTDTMASSVNERALLMALMPLLTILCLPKSKLKRWIVYLLLVVTLYGMTGDFASMLYFGLASLVLLLWKQEEELPLPNNHLPIYLRYQSEKQAKHTSAFDSFGNSTSALEHDVNVAAHQSLPLKQTNTLLHRFANIFQELAKRNPSLYMLESVSTAFSLCEEELQATYLKEQDIQRRVEEVLRAYSFPVTRIVVEKHEVILIHLWISKLHPSELEATIVPLLSNALTLPLHALEYRKAGFFDSFHRITLSSEKGLSLLYDQIQTPIDQECGDAILVKCWQEQMHFMMSDGMGSGKHARTQSTFVLSMIEQFMEANVPMKTAIKLVNQLAMLQNEERYATLDVLTIDRFKKEALLYKSGSIQSYLLRGSQVYSFFSSSLPLGIIERINPEYYTIQLKEGDIILMVSDGADHEKMKEWLKLCAGIHPSKLLRTLYEKRMEEAIDDDISMLLIRVKNDIN